MSRQMYNDKMGVILSDSSKFIRIEEDDTLSNLSKFQLFCKNHRNKFGWNDSEYREIYPTAADMPKLYGLPKIHKQGSPLRPILSMVGAFNHKFAKWLSKSLSGEIRESQSMIRDSFSLRDLIGPSNLHQAYLVSYDVSSLFTNIPVDETIQVIVDKLYPKTPGVKVRDQTWKGISRLIFKRSLIWCLCNQTFSFNGTLYKQIDGCAMGSPLAPLMADIFMNHVLESKIKERTNNHINVLFVDYNSGTQHFRQCRLKFFGRYVDDHLAVFDTPEDAQYFLTYLNSLHHKITFTMETESDSMLPFLDILITRHENNISTTVYRKTTHSGVYSHYTSFIPARMKRQLIYTLVDRAWKLCSSYELWHLEMVNLKTMMMSNGYTENYVDGQIKRYLSNKYPDERAKTKDPVYGPEKLRVYLKVPYLGDATWKLESSLRGCLKRLKLGGIQLVVINKYRRIMSWFTYKDKTPKLMKHNVVYKINCSCGQSYIGYTMRNLITRLKEHTKTTGSTTSVGDHLRDNPTCVIDFDNVEILGQTDEYRIKYLETLFIQKHASSGKLLNNADSSIPLNLFNIPTKLKSGKREV